MPSKVSIYQKESTVSAFVAVAQPEAPTTQTQAAATASNFAVFFIYSTKLKFYTILVTIKYTIYFCDCKNFCGQIAVKIFKNVHWLCYNTLMNLSVIAPTLGEALEELKKYISANEGRGRRTVIFCEDRLTLVAERAVCAAVGGTFNTAVYTFARFMSAERQGDEKLLSSQGSAIVIRGIIERNRENLRLFRRLSASAAARSLYDTIALLYSSGISPEDIAEAPAKGMLADKLKDIALIYGEYTAFLQESGRLDRNVYLRLLPAVIEKSQKIAGADVVFLGFQAFTGTVSECVKACMRTAQNSCGIFVGGAPDIYANEAPAQFQAFSSGLGGCRTVTVKSELVPEAERIRQNLFDPRCFHSAGGYSPKVHIFEAEDAERELEFIAASIKKFVLDGGERYFKISVMLSDVNSYRPALSRVFSQYKIPYYVDERRALSEHPLSSFLCAYLECAAGGCAPQDVDDVISNHLFGLSFKERSIFRNYVLRCANYRGGVRREPRADICAALGFDIAAVPAVRARFLKGLSFLPSGKASSDRWAQGIKELLEYFSCEKVLEGISKEAENTYPARAQFNARAFGGVLSVVDETEELGLGAPYTAREYKKLLASGFAAAEISLIPPKADAVFVGDISETVNAGSNVVFAAGLTGDVPPAGSDTALLTDRELTSLESLNLKISPKISQVNRRRRETVALNLCAFKEQLYLSYPALSGGNETVRSEIIPYIIAMFTGEDGKKPVVVTQKALALSQKGLPYYCSELVPALKMLAGGTLRPEVNSALYAVLESRGHAAEAEGVLKREEEFKHISGGRRLFSSKTGSVSATLLEQYFSCPYKNFAAQGLKLNERPEGSVQPRETGNLIHEVLKELASAIPSIGSEDEARSWGAEQAEKLFASPDYSQLAEGVSGKYFKSRLCAEAAAVSAGVYRQLAASNFKIRGVERWYYMPVGDGVSAGGKVDRIDECEDMVRVIDYKTGKISYTAEEYYAGIKLQLPLYLLAASKGKRPAGAYYFPANIEFSDKPSGDFTLKGFMDCGADVVHNSDTTISDKQRSAFVDAYLNGRKLTGNLTEEDFAYFIEYSALIARRGAAEMFGGNISPSPYVGACEYCRMGGMCGFAAGLENTPRCVEGVTCADVANIVKKIKGDD